MFKKVCRQCHNKHHTLLHINKPTRPNNRGSTNHNRPADAKGNPTAEVNTFCSFKGKSRNQILLATSIVELRNKSGQYVPCRTLLDSASQLHFITERCVQRLRFSKTQTRSSIQGINNSSVVANHCVSLYMRSRHTHWHDSLNCAILSDITGTTPGTKLDTSSWRIPTVIKLANENFNTPGEIDLLFGADLFYEMLRLGRRIRPGYPLLQEAVLEWTLSGKTPVITSQ